MNSTYSGRRSSNSPTGLRYYRPRQAAVAARIRWLRSLEMPLAEIQAVLSGPDPDAVAGHLADHQLWLEARLAGYQHALQALQAHNDYARCTPLFWPSVGEIAPIQRSATRFVGRRGSM